VYLLSNSSVFPFWFILLLMCLVLPVVFYVFLLVWGFAIMVFPLQPGCAIVISPFNSASLMCVVCLGVSVLDMRLEKGARGPL
jgi:hypothetical protein